MSSTSFTQYAQNFMNHMAVPPTATQNVNQNINYYVSNSNVTIQKKETYNINNNILVINKFPDNQSVPNSLNQYTQQNIDQKIVLNQNCTNLKEATVININNKDNTNNKPITNLFNEKEISQEEQKKEQERLRFDRKGESITKGGKKHRISFKDHVDKQGLTQKIEIESYKKYNASNTFAEGEIAKNANASGVSCCSVI